MDLNSTLKICLIGMPGSGKSTVGAKLAEQTGLTFIDTDQLIEKREGAKLSKIIAAKGTQALLDIEEEVLLEMPIEPLTVISTGGSVVYSKEVMERLVENTTVVYLQAKLETVEQRIALQPDRGIASPGDMTIEDVYLERVPLYNRYASVTVDVDDDRPEIIAETIVTKL